MAPALDIDDDTLPPPPSQPPRLLTDEQIISLARHGHLPLPLPKHLIALYAQLTSASDDFFNRPLDVKQSLYAAINGTELGYVSIPGEKDYISFRAQTRHADTDLEQVAAQVWQETYTLLYRILADLARGLNLGHQVWDKILDGISPMPTRLDHATPTLLRIFRYEPHEGIAEPHTDLGLLTLCVCQGRGLQVGVSKDGVDSWTEYTEATLLVGQTLRRLSMGRIRAGLHRVVGNAEGRGSIVFALRPSIKHEIDLGVFPGNQGTIHMAEMWREIWGRAYNVNAPHAVRKKQREYFRSLKEKARSGNDDDDDRPYDITNTRAAFEA